MADVIPSSVKKLYHQLPVLRTENPDEKPAVRWEAAAPPADRVDMSAVARHYARNQKVIDGMLDPSVTPAQEHDLQRDLGVLPTPLLETARRQGVHIWVAQEGDTAVPTRMFQPAPDPDTVRRQLDRWLASGAPRPGPRGSYFTRVSAADGRPHPGETLEDVARRDGAKTPAQVHEFTTLAGHLNASMGTCLGPKTPLYDGQPVVLPDYQYRGGIRLDSAARAEIQGANRGLQVADGLYSPRSHLLLVKAEVLPDPSPTDDGERVVLHEFGHAADYLIRDDPARGPQHCEQMREIHAAALHSDTLITEYARTNPTEHYAEGFEAYWTATRGDGDHEPNSSDANYHNLKYEEPRLFNLLDSEMRAWEGGAVHPQGLQPK